MGTNFYLNSIKHKRCPKCGHDIGEFAKAVDTPLHIGKSSAGWCFALKVYPNEDCLDDETWRGLPLPKNLEDWKKFFGLDEVEIRDEYSRIISTEEMLDWITNRSWPNERTGEPPYGYESWEEFYDGNSAVPGPNNLLRIKTGRLCIAHGDGTYDLVVGDFS